MSLQTDQAAKQAKRAAAHAVQQANASLPATATPVVNTDPPAVLTPGQAPTAYPAPPF